MTCTTTSAALASVFLRVESFWNGNKAPVARSMATISASMTAVLVPAASAASLRTVWSSGHLQVVSCKLREKTRTAPSAKRWHCTLSPSYLCSQVMDWPLSLLRTSETDLLGLASMGYTGTPTRKAHAPCTAQSGSRSSAAASVAYDGASAYAALTTSTAATVRSSGASPFVVRPLGASRASASARSRFATSRTTSPRSVPAAVASAARDAAVGHCRIACANATITVVSASPTRSLPCRPRMMYFVSTGDAAIKSLLIFVTFASEDLVPEIFATSR
mmetsp:Transcript_28602/g.96282  ORF Transcript_28602/g.96282 Transcript_28602/m.96282 type:complete len:276 (+) Transcript_28602:936-1763(+)